MQQQQCNMAKMAKKRANGGRERKKEKSLYGQKEKKIMCLQTFTVLIKKKLVYKPKLHAIKD